MLVNIVRLVTPALAIISGLTAALYDVKGWFIFVVLASFIALFNAMADDLA